MNPNQSKPTTNQHNLQQQSSLNLSAMRLLDQQSMSRTIDLMQQKVYQRIMKKALKYKLTETLKLRKVIQSQDQYHYDQYLQQVYKTIKSNADILDMWIKRNIFQRQQYVKMKQEMLKINQRKERKAAEVGALIEKIGEKYRDRKCEEAVEKFREMRRGKMTMYVPLEGIRAKSQQIKSSIEKRAKCNDLSDIAKAAEEIKQYEMNLEKLTTLTLDKLDKMLL